MAGLGWALLLLVCICLLAGLRRQSLHATSAFLAWWDSTLSCAPPLGCSTTTPQTLDKLTFRLPSASSVLRREDPDWEGSFMLSAPTCKQVGPAYPVHGLASALLRSCVHQLALWPACLRSSRAACKCSVQMQFPLASAFSLCATLQLHHYSDAPFDTATFFPGPHMTVPSTRCPNLRRACTSVPASPIPAWTSTCWTATTALMSPPATPWPTRLPRTS